MASTHIGSIVGPRLLNHGGGRQVSQGTIWTVGGTAPNTSTIDDGRGHLLQSGTNARVFTTSFLEAKTSTQDDSDKYHDRVALALKIDRVRKMLSFSPQYPLFSQTSGVYDHQRTT